MGVSTFLGKRLDNPFTFISYYKFEKLYFVVLHWNHYDNNKRLRLYLQYFISRMNHSCVFCVAFPKRFKLKHTLIFMHIFSIRVHYSWKENQNSKWFVAIFNAILSARLLNARFDIAIKSYSAIVTMLSNMNAEYGTKRYIAISNSYLRGAIW